MLIDRPTRRLHKKYVRTADVLKELKVNLAVRESLQPGLAQRHTNELADLLSQRLIGRSAKNLEAFWLWYPPVRFLSGAAFACPLGEPRPASAEPG